jgi:hypothetical protein
MSGKNSTNSVYTPALYSGCNSSVKKILLTNKVENTQDK